MDGPYRSAPVEASTAAPRDAGIVGEVIGQFADPLAFYRELVQNAIDAGTAAVTVRLAYDAGEQLMRVSVKDEGEGMDRSIVENQLLVLFRSTKERDPTKIGKFGIGFASVLSPGPRVVIVSTARAGKKLTLHLYPDLRYELFDTGPARAAGTTVLLELPMLPGGVDTFVRDSRAALERWCRHASCQITFVAAGLEVRIDRPLSIEGAVVEVRAVSDDGAIVAVVGMTERAEPYGGFFNHGLMLHESAQPLLGKLAFKVQDARLGHTISRDNVRRDAAYDRALDFARALAYGPLPRAVARALAATADADRARYVQVLGAMARAGVTLVAEAWVVPLAEPWGDDGRTSATLASLSGKTLFGSRRRTALTAAFAAAGRPVIDFAAAGEWGTWLAEQIALASGRGVVDVAYDHTAITPVTPTTSDEQLLDSLGRALEAVASRPAPISLAALDGQLGQALAVSGEPGLVHGEHARRSPLGGLRRRPLVLNEAHPHVAAARLAAVVDPAAAASLLARAVLLHYGALAPARSEALLAHALHGEAP